MSPRGFVRDGAGYRPLADVTTVGLFTTVQSRQESGTFCVFRNCLVCKFVATFDQQRKLEPHDLFIWNQVGNYQSIPNSLK